MKKTVKGIAFDTTTAAPKCTFRHGKPIGSITETSYQTSAGHYFLLQTVSGEEAKIIPMNGADMTKWSAPGNSGKPFASKLIQHMLPMQQKEKTIRKG